ncbi:dynein associated protein-domain-containing protein [Cladochytrium replicatum]|nr:dynein associated protein-domain-containing protein [Cladochytrium replicatum]
MAASPASATAGLPLPLDIGLRVEITTSKAVGTIRFVGTTAFAAGKWIGVELDTPTGKNDGTVSGKRYFDCKPSYGLFVKENMIRIVDSAPGTPSSAGPESQLSSPTGTRPTSPQRPGRSTSGVSSTTAARTRRESAAAVNTPPPNVARNTSTSSNTSSGSTRGTRTSAAAVPSSRRGSPTPPGPAGRPLARTQSSSSSTSATSVAPPSPAFGSGAESDPKDVEENGFVSGAGETIEGGTSPLETPSVSKTDSSNRALETIEESPALVNAPAASNVATSTPSPRAPPASAPVHTPTPVRTELDAPRVPSTRSTGPIRRTSVVGTAHLTLDTGLASPSTIPTTAEEPSENPVKIMKELEEARVRIRFLEFKRSEDHAQLSELDKLRATVEQLELSKSKLTGRLSEQTDEIRSLKVQLEQVTGDKMNLEQLLADTSAELEMALVEKEIAEEQSEVQKEELEFLNDMKDELEATVSLLKEEIATLEAGVAAGGIPTAGEDGEGAEARSIEIANLKIQNERLKEALWKLRDISKENDETYKQRLQQLERDAGQSGDLKVKYEKALDDIRQKDRVIEDLRQSLDDNLEAVDLVGHLTEKNDQLQKQIEDYRSAVEDLEAIQALNDELEENHIETEKQMQAEIDFKDDVIREFSRRMNAQEEQITDHERTITRFRQLVKNMESDLESLKSAAPSTAGVNGSAFGHAESQGTPSTPNDLAAAVVTNQARAILNLNMQLQSSFMKAQAKAIELQLRKLDVDQVTQHLELVKPYLPQAFFATEHDVILNVLLFRRLMFKSQMICGFLNEYGRLQSQKLVGAGTGVPETPMSAVGSEPVGLDSPRSGSKPGYGGDGPEDPDLTAYLAEIRQKLLSISALSRRFVGFLNDCTVESYVRMGKVYNEVLGIEKRLNTVVDLMKEERLRGPHVIVDLQRCISSLEQLAQTHVNQREEANKPSVRHQQLLSYIELLDANAERMGAELKKMQAGFVRPTTEMDGRVTATWDKLDGVGKEFLANLPEVLTKIRALRAQVKKLSKRGAELTDQNMTLKADFVSTLIELTKTSNRGVDYCSLLGENVLAHVKRAIDTNETINLAALQQLSFNTSDGLLGVGEDHVGGGLAFVVDGLVKAIADLTSSAEEPRCLDRVLKGDPPWIVRAEALQSDYSVNAELQQQVEQYHDENVGLVYELKIKDLSIQELSAKAELLETRAKESRKLAKEIVTLKEEHAKEKQAFEEALEYLHKDFEELGKENVALKKMARQLERQAGSPAQMRKASVMTIDNESHAPERMMSFPPHQMGGDHDSVEFMLNHNIEAEFEGLKSAIRYLRSENARLKAIQTTAAADFLSDPSDPLVIRAKRMPQFVHADHPPRMERDLDNAPSRRTSVSSLVQGNVLDLIANAPPSGNETVGMMLSDQANSNNDLRGLLLQTRLLTRGLNDALTEPKVVDISRAPVGDTKAKWIRRADDPQVQLTRRRNIVEALARRGEDIMERIKLQQGSTNVGSQVVEGAGAKELDGAEGTLIGRIRLGAAGASGLVKRVNLMSFTEFQSVHAVFAQ